MLHKDHNIVSPLDYDLYAFSGRASTPRFLYEYFGAGVIIHLYQIDR